MRSIRCLGLLIGLLLASQLVVLAQDTSTLIAFVGKRGENEDIFLTTQDNSITYNLTDARSRDWHPSWASDGARIAFSTDRDGNNEIYTMDANGQNPRNLTANPASDTSPDWSPVADEIAFISDREGGFDLYVQNLASGAVRRLTTDAQAKSDPDWSPDGSRIVFWQLLDQSAQLKVIEVASGEVTLLLAEGQNQWPAWSPDGREIAFFSPSADGKLAVRLYALEDGSVTDFVSNSVDNARPEWSPDGQQLAFMSNRDGNFNIYIASADGISLSRLTSNPEDDTSPAWQPRPADLDFSDTTVGQGVNMVAGAIDPAQQVALGPGDATIFAPEVANPADLFTVRLQLAPAVAAGAPQPTPDLPARDSEAIEIYRFMGARLKLFGGDLTEQFIVYPEPTEYVIQVQEDGENYWEWMLQPTDAARTGTTRFIVELYLPTFEANGTVIETRITNFMVEVTFDAAAATPEENLRVAVVPETPEVGFAVEYIDNEYFSIIFLSAIDPTRLTIVGRGQPVMLIQDFGDLSLIEGLTSPGQCFTYMLAGATPVLSRECRSERMAFDFDLPMSQIFWFNRREGGVQDVTIQIAEQTFVCPAELAPDRCEF